MRAFKSSETVKLGDNEYTLAIDIEIIDALEDEFDLGFDKLLPEVIGKARLGKISRLLRGLLIRHHPDMTLDEAGSLAMDYGEEMGEAITRLIIKASPEEEAKDENPPSAHRGTGGSSSPHGAPRASRRQSSGAKRRELSSSS